MTVFWTVLGFGVALLVLRWVLLYFLKQRPRASSQRRGMAATEPADPLIYMAAGMVMGQSAGEGGTAHRPEPSSESPVPPDPAPPVEYPDPGSSFGGNDLGGSDYCGGGDGGGGDGGGGGGD
jgi:hypothetical protein